MNASFPVPFPCTLDLGVLRVEIGRKCVVFKRSDREFPHVTQFYQPHPRRGQWWLHATRRGRGGREDRKTIAWWNEGDASAFTRNVEGLLVPRMLRILRPVSLADMTEQEWLAVVPSANLLAVFLRPLLRGGRILDFGGLQGLFDGPDGDLLLDSLFDHCVLPDRLQRPGQYPVLRVTDEAIESGFVQAHRAGSGHWSWYFLPHDWLDPADWVGVVAPGLSAVVHQIANELEIDLPTRT